MYLSIFGGGGSLPWGEAFSGCGWAAVQLRFEDPSQQWLLSHGAQAPGPRASVVVALRLSCSASCGIFPDQGSNPCPLHGQVGSSPGCVPVCIGFDP